MIKKIFVLFLSSMLVSCPLFAQTGHKAKVSKPVEEVSTTTAQATEVPAVEVVSSTAVAALEDTSKILTEAIAGLNYKLEYLTSRNTQLSKDMDDLRDALKEQKNSLA